MITDFNVYSIFWSVDCDDRICDICNLNNIGDEFHYLFECTFFENERKKYYLLMF
jgi:hypothetical protein